MPPRVARAFPGPAPPWRVLLRGVQGLVAAGEAAWVFAWAALRSRPGEARTPRALARAYVRLATRLGATFIKIGQIASTRRDLLPGPAVEELSALQDRVPPFPFERVQAVLEAELERPWAEVFARLDPEPVASASVAQVHRGVLAATGQSVAVKVRRPDVLAKAALDRSLLVTGARLLERVVPSLRLVALEEAMRAFCREVEAQLHLLEEAANNRRFAANFADDPDVLFPRVHPEVSSDAVLTMDFVEGLREQDLHTGAVDVRRVVAVGMRAVSRMIFLHGFVHADLHPGNLRFLPPGRIVFLDLGLVGRLADVDRLTTAQLLFAFATGDGPTVARLFYENAPHTATPDYAAYEAEVCAFVDSLRRLGLGRVQLTAEIGRLFDILRRHRIQARAHMTMVNLALMTAEGLGKRLAPDLSLAEAALPYLAEALGRPSPTAAARPA